MDGFEHVTDPSIEAFHHPTRLGMISGCEPVFDRMFLAGHIEQVFSRRSSTVMSKPIGEAGCATGQQVVYGKFEIVEAQWSWNATASLMPDLGHMPMVTSRVFLSMATKR